jgi:hypothetical protein
MPSSVPYFVPARGEAIEVRIVTGGSEGHRGGSTGLRNRIKLFDAGLVEYVPQANEQGDTWPVASTAGRAVICRNVHCELPQCSASVRLWAGVYNLGLPSSLFALP